jgi:DNA-binding GntR family transcriptional regulator
VHNYEFKIVASLTSDVNCVDPAPSHRTGARLLPDTATHTAADAERPPLHSRALYQDVAERLRQQIFNRELEPGGWIDEQKTAAAYGISRTPLREALKVLAAEGLVTMKLRRGAYVTEMSTTDVAQVYHLMALLESDAAGRVAASASPDHVAELQALHDRLEAEADQRDAFFATNEQFHLKLLALAGNRWSAQIVLDLRKVMKLNRHLSLFKQGRLAESLAEHRAVMAAIAAGDAVEATRLMRAHFDNGLQAASA